MRKRFEISGTLIGFAAKGFISDHLVLSSEGRELTVNLGKDLGEDIQGLLPGTSIKVTGEISCKSPACLTYRAYRIERCEGCGGCPARQNELLPDRRLGCIQICSKKNCWRRGGEELYDRLRQAIRREGLTEQVMLLKSGCQGNCHRRPSSLTLGLPAELRARLGQHIGEITP